MWSAFTPSVGQSSLRTGKSGANRHWEPQESGATSTGRAGCKSVPHRFKSGALWTGPWRRKDGRELRRRTGRRALSLCAGPLGSIIIIDQLASHRVRVGGNSCCNEIEDFVRTMVNSQRATERDGGRDDRGSSKSIVSKKKKKKDRGSKSCQQSPPLRCMHQFFETLHSYHLAGSSAPDDLRAFNINAAAMEYAERPQFSTERAWAVDHQSSDAHEMPFFLKFMSFSIQSGDHHSV